MKKIIYIIIICLFTSGLVAQEKADGLKVSYNDKGIQTQTYFLDSIANFGYDTNTQTVFVSPLKGNKLVIPINNFFQFEFPEVDIDIKKSVFNGYVQKGPYVNGSSVNIVQLDKHLNQTGKVFSTQIIDNSGTFEQRNINFTSKFIELKADGYYFNEVIGANSTGPLTLYALADISDFNSVNINILTHLERQRIMYLMQNESLSFSAAKKQARSEVLNIFTFTLPNNVASESLNIADDALLLAVSVILQGNSSIGDLSELLANISSDIRTDGKLDNPILGSQLMNNAALLNLDQIISNMKKKYGGLGIAMNISSNELKKYIEQFQNNSKFEQTLPIIYPLGGRYGLNILSEEFENVNKISSGNNKYSVIAELPAGKSSLKIVIKEGGNNSDYIEFIQGSNDNWSVSNVDDQFILTAIKSGKPADASFFIVGNCIIEYYENGAIEPTKIKNLYAGGEGDEHEREMLIAFYQSTNGDNWIKNDNWCSKKPVSEWYGIKTWKTEYSLTSIDNHVRSIELPNNNLTGSASITDFKSLYSLNILNGNQIESLTIDNCGNKLPDDYSSYHSVFYHDYSRGQCNIKALNISNSNGYISVNGYFSAESVTISNCNLSSDENIYFNSASTNIGTLTVSNSTMGYFYADNSKIGNTTIENCSFKGSNAYIYVGNKTQVNNCTGLRYIYSSRPCSDLIVTNTACSDIRCKKE